MRLRIGRCFAIETICLTSPTSLLRRLQMPLSRDPASTSRQSILSGGNGCAARQTYLCENTVDITDNPVTIYSLVVALHVFKYGTQVHVSLKPEQPVEVERTALISLHSAKILANTPKHKVLPYLHIMLEEHRGLPMEEDSQAKGV